MSAIKFTLSLVCAFISFVYITAAFDHIDEIYLKDSSIIRGEVTRDIPGDRLWIISGDSTYLFNYNQFYKHEVLRIAGDTKDIVYLKDGSKITGNIIAVRRDKSIRIKTDGGNEIIFPKSEVFRVEQESYGIIKNVKKSYIEFGFNIGTPGGLNLAFGGFGDVVGFRLSGFYLPTIAGIQANLNFKLYESRNTLINIALLAGSMEAKDPNNNSNSYPYSADNPFKYWTYYGMALDMNFSGFFLELGLSDGKGDFSSPQLLFQIGYMKRFNDE